MSSGRLTMRGLVFQGRVFAPFALAGGAVVVTDPNDGWIANSRGRVSITMSRERVNISESRSRVWIAQDKIQ